MKRGGQIRLLVADEHNLMRAGLRLIFAQTPEFAVAAEATNGAEVLKRLSEDLFDVLLLDLNMRAGCGVDLISRVKARQPQLSILVLTASNEPQMAIRALRAGANGYITKNCEPDILQSAIRKVAARGNYIAPDIAEKMVFQMVSKQQPLPHHQLTDRELEVLQQLIAGLSPRQIAERLSISDKTVSTHKTRLMEKLSVSSTVDLMRYAVINGLLGHTSGHFAIEE
jgi:DNA-binding NarL/FixJ family response regulator